MFSTQTLRRTVLALAACTVLPILSFPALSQEGDGSSQESEQPHAGMLRFPDVSATHIVFTYANDLWLVAREGGTATPLASPPGLERYPRFSPDGTTLAFVGNYDGDSDVYTVPVAGGVPRRVTHHPTNERLDGWSPDGRLLFTAARMGSHWRMPALYTVSAEGGLPEPLPVPYGSAGAVSDDGQWLAYTPFNRDQRTWKRYRGGLASDIWLLALDGSGASRRVTEWEGTDTQPMWQGGILYYLSDAGPAHRLNIWRYDPTSGERRQVTHHADYDVKWPSIGPGAASDPASGGGGEIVFQLGTELRLLDLASERETTVEVVIPGARPKLRPQSLEVGDQISGGGISPSGKRVIVEARGDVWTLPAEHGSPRNLTRTSGVAERSPAWSPDGRLVAYFADTGGEYQLYVRPSDGSGQPRALSDFGSVAYPEHPGYFYAPTWSPDSEHIAFWDRAGRLYLADATASEAPSFEQIDHSVWMTFEGPRVHWSPDSAWLAYARTLDGRGLTAIFLHHVASGATHQVTSAHFRNGEPTFSDDSNFLFHTSHRDFTNPSTASGSMDFAYANTERLLAVPLRTDVEWPLAAKSDEETWDDTSGDGREESAKDSKEDGAKAEDGADEDGKDENGKDEDEKPLEIDLDGFERRARLLDTPQGLYSQLAAAGGKLFYRFRTAEEQEWALKVYDLAEGEETTLLEDVASYQLSADGKRLGIVQSGPRGMRFSILDAKPGAEPTPVSTDGMLATIDPRAEWAQVFHEAWRLYRDFFYAENLHGVDWPAIRDQYAALLDDCNSREDVGFVIAEMISELNVGHSYYQGGGHEDVPRRNVGMLGVDFDLRPGENGFRIDRIYRGGPWDADVRNPLEAPGVDVHEGDLLLAVNGVPVDTGKDPWAAFLGLAGRTVTLTLASGEHSEDANSGEDTENEPRDVVVELLNGDFMHRYWAWVEANRAHVEEASGGRIGYIYVPNTSTWGRDNLFRQFHAQRHLDALIIDDRWNGGGSIPTRFIELLNRPVQYFLAGRDKETIMPWPPMSHSGPKAMLINGNSASGGDSFPYFFRAAGLGKLIGTRTWGGVVGLSGGPQLIDGDGVTVPRWGVFELDGTWGMEGHGVDPDIEVVDDPALMLDGGDPQLDVAVEHLLEELERNPPLDVPRPPEPDRSGMGLPDSDH